MIRTFPISLSHLSNNLVLGPRVQGLLSEPFEVLKRRVLQESKDKKTAKPAYYIDTRDLDTRLDQVVGQNWCVNFSIADHDDRVSVIARLTINTKYGPITREDCQEELKFSMKTDWETKEKTEKSNDLVIMKAAPNAYKRAAVHFGVGAYIYGLKDYTRYEPIDNYKQFTNPLDFNKLPDFVKPTPGPTIVLNELKYMAGHDDSKELQALLKSMWGISTLKDLDRDTYIRLAACMARISDYCDDANISVTQYLSNVTKAHV